MAEIKDCLQKLQHNPHREESLSLQRLCLPIKPHVYDHYSRYQGCPCTNVPPSPLNESSDESRACRRSRLRNDRSSSGRRSQRAKKIKKIESQRVAASRDTPIWLLFAADGLFTMEERNVKVLHRRAELASLRNLFVAIERRGECARGPFRGGASHANDRLVKIEKSLAGCLSSFFEIPRRLVELPIYRHLEIPLANRRSRAIPLTNRPTVFQENSTFHCFSPDVPNELAEKIRLNSVFAPSFTQGRSFSRKQRKLKNWLSKHYRAKLVCYVIYTIFFNFIWNLFKF